MSKIFYKFRKISDFVKDEVVNHYFYFSRPSELNDPYDCQIQEDYTNTTIQDIINWGGRVKRPDLVSKIINDPNKLNDEDFLRNMKKDVDSLENRWHILCLTEMWSNTQMWAYYGDSRKGVCFGYESFEKNKEYFIEFEKTNIANNFFIPSQVIDLKKDCYFMVLIPIKYNRDTIIPYNPYKYNKEAIQQGFTSKSKEWAHENEYRSVMISMNEIDSFNNKFTYNKEILREVIFGDKTSQENLLSIYNYIKENYDINKIKFFKTIKGSDPNNYERLEERFIGGTTNSHSLKGT